MQLYERIVSLGGKVTYKEHTPTINKLEFIEHSELITLLSVITMSMLISAYDQLPPSDIVHRKIRNVEREVKELAKLNHAPLDETLINAGVAGWNAAIKTMQAELGGGNA